MCNRCGRRPPACRTGLTKCCGTRLLLFHCKCPFFLSFVWPLVYSSNNSYKWVSLPPSLDTRNNAPSAQAVLLILTAMPLQVTLCNTHTHVQNNKETFFFSCFLLPESKACTGGKPFVRPSILNIFISFFNDLNAQVYVCSAPDWLTDCNSPYVLSFTTSVSVSVRPATKWNEIDVLTPSKE